MQGLHYETTPSGLSGSTSAKGEYQYVEGDTVTFSIGSLQFPSVTAKGIVTPLDLAKTNNATHQIAVNIAALLQSLDTDGNAENGININYAIASAQASALNFDLPYASFAALSGVTHLTANSGSSTKMLVAEASASAHLQASINKLNSADIIGTWYAESGSAKYVLFILNSSQYTILSYEGGATIETGIYSWDKATSFLTLNHKELAGSNASHRVANGNTLSVNQNTLTTTGPNGTTVFSKLTNSGNALIGGWVRGSSVIAFTEKYYFHGQTGPADRAGHTGAEYGTYNFSGSNITYVTSADTNGQWGFSHPCNILESHLSETPNDLSCLNGVSARDSVTVSGNNLEMFSAINALANRANQIETNEPEHFNFQRVRENNFDVFGAPLPLLGSWVINGGGDIFIFSDYKTFTHIKTSTNDPNCQPGIVTATYTWDPQTFQFNLNILSDTTGSDPDDGCAADGNLNRLTINGNTLVLADGAGGTEGVNQFSFMKAANTNNLLGTWHLSNKSGDIVLTFSDTGYFLSSIDNQDDGDGATSGTETGSYSLNGSNLTLQVKTNTDGTGGLSGYANKAISIVVSGNSLTLDGKMVFQRLNN